VSTSPCARRLWDSSQRREASDPRADRQIHPRLNLIAAGLIGDAASQPDARCLTEGGLVTIRYVDANYPLGSLFLDPNNPRFADVTAPRLVPEGRVHEVGAQERARNAMTREVFDIDQLKESIKNLGYLPANRLEVVRLPGPEECFKVIEGNRRLMALIELRDEHRAGEETLPDTLLALMDAIPVVVLRADSADELEQRVREDQGRSHVPGQMAWKPYQQAQLVGLFISEGRSATEIRALLGLSATRFTSLRRAFFAMEQMKQDAEFEGLVTPDLFSHFEEALSKPAIRDWLGWRDEQSRMLDEQHRIYFYRWITSTDEDGTKLETPKVIDAKDFRQFPTLLQDPVELERFITEPALSLRDAARAVHVPAPVPDWREVVRANLDGLRRIPALEITGLTNEDIALLQAVRDGAEALLQQVAASGGATASADGDTG
jgi:hypothetical protein